MSYRLELIGTDGKAATETHELVEPTEWGLRIKDGGRETGIPWGVIQVWARTPLDVAARPTVHTVPPRRRARRP